MQSHNKIRKIPPYLLIRQVFWLPDFRNSIQKTANTQKHKR